MPMRAGHGYSQKRHAGQPPRRDRFAVQAMDTLAALILLIAVAIAAASTAGSVQAAAPAPMHGAGLHHVGNSLSELPRPPAFSAQATP